VNNISQKQDEYLVMLENVHARLYKYPSLGHTKAFKTFLDNPGKVEKKRSIRNQHNNFKLINGATITQEQIKQLPEAQRTKLFEVLQSVSTGLL
jgi:hypothetical protein